MSVSIAAGFDPTWEQGRENIKYMGRSRGRDVAEIDSEAGEIVRDSAVLRELGNREFTKWWSKELPKEAARPNPHNMFPDPKSFDVEEMQRIYCAAFRSAYTNYFSRLGTTSDRDTSKLLERVLPPLPSLPTVRVVTTRRLRGSRLYELELVDPDYPDEAIAFELQVSNEGDAELREQ